MTAISNATSDNLHEHNTLFEYTKPLRNTIVQHTLQIKRFKQMFPRARFTFSLIIGHCTPGKGEGSCNEMGGISSMGHVYGNECVFSKKLLLE